MENPNKLRNFIKNQLVEMGDKVCKNYEENQEKRNNNIFLLIQDENAKKYMAIGRSFDSQLGTRLQKIALYMARLKYGIKNVPNMIILTGYNKKIEMTTISIDIELAYNYKDNKKIKEALQKFSMNQKVYWDDDWKKHLTAPLKKYCKGYEKNILISKYSFEVTSSEIMTIQEIFEDVDKKNNGIPIDLIYIDTDDKDAIYTYEVKSGGNLDTKNAPSNAKEVKRLEKLFSFANKNYSRFATCYDSLGNGKADGSIAKNLPEDSIFIGPKFWEGILPSDIGFEDFKNIYRQAFLASDIEKKIKEL